MPSRNTSSIQKEGRCATLSGFAARAGAEANHALTFKPDHSLGADHCTVRKHPWPLNIADVTGDPDPTSWRNSSKAWVQR